jgi:GNAT superfamily N-acetyltransferase
VAQKNLTIRAFASHEWPVYRELRLRSLAESPDAFCSTLASEQARTPEEWAGRLSAAVVSADDYPLIALVGDVMGGLIWAKRDAFDPHLVNVYQMWVAPESRGHGVAVGLLREAIAWAQSRNARHIQLGVTWRDSPAVRLYVREGFQAYGSPEPLRPGSHLLSQTMRRAIPENAV